METLDAKIEDFDLDKVFFLVINATDLNYHIENILTIYLINVRTITKGEGNTLVTLLIQS